MVDYLSPLAIGIAVLSTLLYYLQLRKMPSYLTKSERIERLESDLKVLSHKVSDLEDSKSVEVDKFTKIEVSLAQISNDISWIKLRMGKD